MSSDARWYCLAPRPWVESEEGGHWGLPSGTLGSVDLAPIGSQAYVFATSDRPFDPNDVAVRIGDGTRLQAYVPSGGERQAWRDLLGVLWTPGWTLLDALWAVLTVQSDPDGELRAKPLTPTHRGNFELHLGGHSLIRSARMPRKATDLPHWPQLQRVLQNDHRAVQRQDRQLARKLLGAQARKYQLPPEAARDLIGDRKTMPLRPTTQLRDDFGRPDRADLDGDEATWESVGQGWQWHAVVKDLVLGINDQQAYRSTGSGQTHYQSGTLSTGDQRVETQINGSHSNRFFGVAARCVGGEDTCYSARAGWGSENNAGLRRIVAGQDTVIVSEGLMRDAPAYLVADGSTLTYLTHDVGEITATDTALTDGLRSGIETISSSFDYRMQWWSAEDLLAPPPARRHSPFASPAFNSPVFGGGPLQ